MKCMPFKILTAMLCGLFFRICLSVGYMPNAYAQDIAAEGIASSPPQEKTSSGVSVIENIEYDPVTQIYTYTYTLRNLGKNLVWWWGIWYEEDPQAILDDSQADEQGFTPADVTDCSPGWKNTAPQNRMGYYLYNGPNGEMGFYSTYASDFRSGNSPIVPAGNDLPLIGGQWGWNGQGANILTAYGIQKGQTGYYVIRSTKYFLDNKMFFYNTKDYWNSYYDSQTGQLIIRGFEFVSTTQRSYSISTSSGEPLPASPDDPVLPEIDGGDGWQGDDSTRQVISSPPAAVLATPVLSPSSVTFTGSMSVSITCATQGAIIRYTKDGSEPTVDSPAYTAPLTLTKTTTLKAKAFKSGYTASDTASETYTKLEKAAIPSISPVSRTFSDSITVSLTCTTQGAAIRYTIDGSEPTETSSAYSTPLILTSTTTIKAKAFKSGFNPSDTVSGTYTKLIKQVATPGFSLPSGIFHGSVSVSITCATQGAIVRYTTDGSEPIENSPIYTAPLTLTSTTTIKAKAFKDGYTPSAAARSTYTEEVETVAKPAFSPLPRTFTDSVAVSITCATQGATIRYTIDGSEPTENSPIYAAPLTLTNTATIKAQAFKSGDVPSDAVSGTYTKLAAPKQPATKFSDYSSSTTTTITLWNQPWSYSYSSIAMDYQPWSSTSSSWSYQPWSSTSSWDYQSWSFTTSSWNYQPWSSNF
ncbi:MAG: chitobiase/beta-hexosaminidase C-terminal domain-containing protein [bacterium]